MVFHHLSILIFSLFGLTLHSLHIPKTVQLFDLSKKLIPYKTAWQWQNALVENHVRQQSSIENMSHKKDYSSGSLLVLQHNSVYTLGSGTQSNSGPFGVTAIDGTTLDFETVPVDRAGQATYHGPGQLVMYPILDLTHFKRDIHQYLRRLEQVVINTLTTFGIHSGRIEGATGVWMTGTTHHSVPSQQTSFPPSKVAAIGIKLRRWVTMHGVAVNVCPDMRYFDNIVPCGIRDKAVGSVSQFAPEATTERVAQELVRQFGLVFDVQIDTSQGDEVKIEQYLNNLPIEIT